MILYLPVVIDRDNKESFAVYVDLFNITTPSFIPDYCPCILYVAICTISVQAKLKSSSFNLSTQYCICLIRHRKKLTAAGSIFLFLFLNIAAPFPAFGCPPNADLYPLSAQAMNI